MTDTLRVACVQITGKPRVEDNIALIDPMIREAAAKGADLVCLPEICNLVQKNREEQQKQVRTEAEDPALAAFRALAKELGIWIHAGSLAIRPEEGDRLANRGFLIAPDGTIRAKYDKIHMFDVDLENAESYRESFSYRPGEHAVLAETPWGGYGMGVCYDVRFPALFRDLAGAGAKVLTMPACFTQPTGKAHWHVLLRARAIENGCFVIAAAQCGEHEDGRKTYGHSLIIDPWGEVLADAGPDQGIILADLDMARVDEVRGMVPSLKNGRDYAPPVPLDLAQAGE
ncbi:carbon-nitrogen hydrolase family protein [Hwanghaeella grinnelliae]|uniref:Carbon-nitrogen hydrolase family protein n=1 Tax=Hwanghaeella grinnelliae TaxID=2500179 RepID=A0A437QMU8_9PROT|nr:carbon-nitrogen hydrolase family protein [Hwanghaeella grinnelliae]RVU35866.1 carbon-nitrogen hydrolase family protein [Hwanghaeella grinnelliae]